MSTLVAARHPTPAQCRTALAARAAAVTTISIEPAVVKSTRASRRTQLPPLPLRDRRATRDSGAQPRRSASAHDRRPLTSSCCPLLFVGWLLWLGLVASMIGAVAEARTRLMGGRCTLARLYGSCQLAFAVGAAGLGRLGDEAGEGAELLGPWAHHLRARRR